LLLTSNPSELVLGKECASIVKLFVSAIIVITTKEFALGIDLLSPLPFRTARHALLL
jgi:hypothetical protein